MDSHLFRHNLAPRGSFKHNRHRDALIVDVNASLSAFGTEVTDLARLWIIHDTNRTADPATFEIALSLWRPRRESLKGRLDAYWSAEDSKCRSWVIYYQEQCENQGRFTDRAMATANVMFQAKHEALVKRCKELGFLDFLQVGFLSGGSSMVVGSQ